MLLVLGAVWINLVIILLVIENYVSEPMLALPLFNRQLRPASHRWTTRCRRST
jgi:hypothetical protein